MATLNIDIGEDGKRQAVRLLQTVRASNGQEFLAGWIAGFAPATCAHLVASGSAEWVVPPEPQPEPPVLDTAPLTIHATGVVGPPPAPKKKGK